MSDDRKVEVYRRHELVAAFHHGKYRGRARKGKNVVADVEGSSVDDALPALRSQIDKRLSDEAARRSQPPTSLEYVEALRKVTADLSDRQLAMLRAHYAAPQRSLTATELATAAGYAGYSAANLQYGLVGRALYEELPFPLATRSDGSMIYTWAPASSGDRTGSEEQWVWQMRPEVAVALEILGLHTG
jgi:hypothetical protein